MLYVIPTPIGNIEDITIRAKRLLGEAAIILSEDARVTSKLLTLLDISNKPQYVGLVSHHDINTAGIEKALAQATDKVVCLVTDAGTPGISDPGREVITRANELGIAYTVLPGATSIIPAVAAAGFVKKEFTFLGFLPLKKGRQKAWKILATSPYPVCVLESVHRMEKWIEEAKLYLQPTQKLCICREISKMHEWICVTTVGEINKDSITMKGEFVIVVDTFDEKSL